MVISESIRSGRELHGNDMDAPEIEAWYRDEEYGYYQLSQVSQGSDTQYPYGALNEFHAFGFLRRRKFKTCVALGCADGRDVAPLAGNVDRFVAIEPAEKWWRTEIGGTPATYIKPEITGEMPYLADGSCDLVTSLGVLHHIPNVGHVIGEIARILEPGGLFVLREPMSSMGDWTKPRYGLTKRERGIPRHWLTTQMLDAGFSLLRERPVMFSLTPRLPFLTAHYNIGPVVLLDWAICELMAWNNHYWRDNVLKKIAPTCSYIIAAKQG